MSSDEEGYGSQGRDEELSQEEPEELTEEEEEEEERGRERPKKRAKHSASMFFEEEAAVGDDEDEEEEEEGLRDFIAEGEEAESMRSGMPGGPMGSFAGGSRRMGGRSHLSRVIDQIEAGAQEGGENEEDLMGSEDDEEDGQGRYSFGPGGDYSRPGGGSNISLKDQALYPTPADPKLFMVPCLPGHERKSVIFLMQKFLDMSGSEAPLKFTSAFHIDALKGRIYVESPRETYVQEACRGIRGLRWFKTHIVPIKEMVEVLTAGKTAETAEQGSWVRIKKGIYKGDIGQVFDVDEAKGNMVVKLVPRIDLAKMASEKQSEIAEGGKKRRFPMHDSIKNRPPQRLLSDDEIKSSGMQVFDKRDPKSGHVFTVLGSHRFKEGYVYRVIPARSLEVKDVIPTLDELSKFRGAGKRAGDDLTTSLSKAAEIAQDLGTLKKSAEFFRGDTVRVSEGDLMNVVGQVISVDAEFVVVQPSRDTGLEDALKFQRSQLTKWFKVGDHVKIMNGKHSGETGLVVKVEVPHFVTIFPDGRTDQIKVFMSDIVRSESGAAAVVAPSFSGEPEKLDRIGEYGLQDLVMLGPTTFGIILKVDKEGFRILDGNGQIVNAKYQEIGKKLNSRNSTTFDKHGISCGQDDRVRIVDGLNKGREATIKHINRGVLFLYSRDVAENNGIFIAKNRQCEVMAGAGGKKPGAVGGGYRMPPIHTSGPGMARQGNPNQKDMSIFQKRVMIVFGDFKGRTGTVKDATASAAHVELDSQRKVVKIPRTSTNPGVKLLDQVGSSMGGGYGGATPSHAAGAGGMTPMSAWGKTPMHGSETPRHDDPSRTPAWEGGSRTPSWRGGEDGSRTPAWGAEGSRTPAWSGEGSRTPMHDGSRTPSWGGRGGQTPSREDHNTPYLTPQIAGSGYDQHHQPSTPGYPSAMDYSTPQPPTTVSTPYGDSYGTTPYTPNVLPTTPSVAYSVSTPAVGGATATESWALSDIEVNILSGSHAGSKGVVSTVSGGGMCSVSFPTTGERKDFYMSELEPVRPGRKDKVKVLKGEFRGQEGQLMGVDKNDVVVKMSDLSYKIFEMSFLAKSAASS